LAHLELEEESVSNVDFETVWARIVAHEGQLFEQIRGQRFSFVLEANSLHLSTTNQSIARAQMEMAFEMVPLLSTTQLQHLRAPSYIYAILMDSRIRKQDW
jgi:hypothetical protein